MHRRRYSLHPTRCPGVSCRNAKRLFCRTMTKHGRYAQRRSASSLRSPQRMQLPECKGRRCAVLPGDASLRDAIRTGTLHAAAGTRTLRAAPDGFGASLPARTVVFVISFCLSACKIQFLPMTDPQKSPGNVASRRDASLGRKKPAPSGCIPPECIPSMAG
jgi:hypothetical protein